MNKVLVAVFILLFSVSANANEKTFWFSAKNWSRNLKEFCEPDKLRAAVTKANQLRRQNNSRLTVSEMADVFDACGKTSPADQKAMISKMIDYQKCKRKVYVLPNVTAKMCSDLCKQKANEIGCSQIGKVVKVSGKCVCNDPGYWRVCGDEKSKTGGREYCVEEFSDSSKMVDVGVQMMQAVALAQEYAKVRHGVSDLQCSQNYRTSWSRDFVRCTSVKSNSFYEFVFEDVTASLDAGIQDSVKKAIGVIHNRKYVHELRRNAYEGACTQPLLDSLKRFGYTASTEKTFYNAEYCVIGDGNIKQTYENPYGIDRLAFYKGIQVRANAELVAKLKEYVRSKMGNDKMRSFDCDPNPRQIRNVVGGLDNDDLVTCHVNGKTVEFVFDDLSEAWDAYDKGGRQGMDCIVAGGTYNGRACMHLTEAQCRKLSGQTSACTVCRAAKWNSEKQICELPASSSATNIEKGIGVATVVVGAAAAVVVVVGTGGTASIVLVSAGAAASVGSEIAIQTKVQPWFEKANKCQQASCAEQMLAESMKSLINLSSDFTRSESAAVESELVRLINLAPDSFFKKLYGEIKDAPFFSSDSWDSLQVVRAIGNVLQIVGGINAFKQIISVNSGWRNFANAVKLRVQSAAKAINTVGYSADGVNAGYSMSIGNDMGAAGTVSGGVSGVGVQKLLKAL